MSDPTAARRNIVNLLKKRADSRITIRETADGLGIDNPSHRQMPVILFLLLWLGGWSVGEYFALNEIFRGGTPLAADLFLIVWVTFWTLGGAAAWYFVLWQLFGVERLFITGGALVREAGLWRLRRRQVFDLARVSEVELSAAPAAANSTNRAISFKVDGKQFGFGIALSKEEAEQSLAAIRRHLVSGKPKNAIAGGDHGETDPGKL